MDTGSEPEGRHRALGERGIASRRQARQTRRFYTLTAASTVIPGLGLIHTRRRTGIAMVAGFFLTILAVCGWGLAKGVTSSVIGVGVSRQALMILIPVVAVGALIWIWGIVTTARDNMPPGMSGRPRIAMVVFASLAALLIFAPAAQSVRYAVIQRSLIGTVFDQLRPAGAAAPGDGDDPWAGTGRVNVMLVGSDAGEDRDGIRPDSIMVASVDTKTGETVLFGIPRNLQNIPFSKDNPLSKQYPKGFNCGDQCLMEYVWTLGRDNAELFPGDDNPGLTVTKDAASQILGLDIDYTTVIDLQGFTQLVDAMGGVTIDVKERVCIGCKIEGGVVVGTTGYIEPGVQKLDGYRALWYSRSRAESTDGDFSRMRRQRCMVGALLNQVNPTSMLVRYPKLAKTLEDNVKVDIPQQDLKAWSELVLRIQDKGKIQSLPLTNKNIDVNKPDYAKIHAMVDEAINPPPPAPKTSTPKKTPSSTSTTEPSSSSTTDTDELSDITATC
ncbi:LCP family protein [Janibacter indicus]|uniref:Transcriptional attenuator, LytR family n=2 Tax=Janibacter TaxID=53457 RepID=A0A1W1YNQ9_9MICO|nr:LCP family protein [Janibacter indicus]SMC37850.1 transcriptional attenuator, LytR family [Janibacter indicus]